MKDLLRKSENRGTVANAAVIIGFLGYLFWCLEALKKKRSKYYKKKLLVLGGIGVAGEGLGEVARIAAERKKNPFRGQRRARRYSSRNVFRTI